MYFILMQRNYVNFKRLINATLFDENDKDYIDFILGLQFCSVGMETKELQIKL